MSCTAELEQEHAAAISRMLLPFQSLHAWYVGWFKTVNPSGKPVEQRTMAKRIKELAVDDGWRDSGEKRTVNAWMPYEEKAACRYARQRKRAGYDSYEFDPTDKLGIWFSHSKPDRARGLVLGAVEDYCLARATTPAKETND